MPGESKVTTDHKTIREWAESRGGKPATVKRTEKEGEVGVLRIDFPGYRGESSLEEITWDEFFQKFDEKNLAFLYQEHTSSGEESRFFKLVSRDTAEQKTSGHKEDEKSSGKAEHEEDEKAHAHKDEEKTPKAGRKEDEKAHTHKAEPKAEKTAAHKEDKKSSQKATHKEDEKAHKAEEKTHKTEHK